MLNIFFCFIIILSVNHSHQEVV